MKTGKDGERGSASFMGRSKKSKMVWFLNFFYDILQQAILVFPDIMVTAFFCISSSGKVYIYLECI